MALKDILANIWNTSFGSPKGPLGLSDPSGYVEEIEKQNEEDAANDWGRKDFLPDSLKNNSDPNTTSNPLGSWLDNALTGDRDFQRQYYLQKMQQEFNSAEAAKAYERQVNTAQNATLWQAEQLRQLGVNPAWAIAGGGGSSPTVSTAPTATSQATNASSSGSQFGATLGTLGQLVINAAKLALLSGK